jgi:hypothetical protein
MSAMKDPFEAAFVEGEAECLTSSRPAAAASSARASFVATARLHGFDLEGRPLVAGLDDVPGEIVVARSIVPLGRPQIGSRVVLLFEHGNPRSPIVVGVVREPGVADPQERSAREVTVQADDDHVVLSAGRQITLQCGEASITLTRAGKVVIRGKYVVSRSSGYNKIKGAVVDIN